MSVTFAPMFRDQVKIPFGRKMVLFILTGFITLLAGCGGDQQPEGILSEKQMVSVMTDLYLAEEKVNNLSVPYDSIKELFPMFSERAFRKAGISDTVFRKSLDYYMGQPQQLENIYTTLVDSLNLKAQRASAHKKKDAAPE
ncbi:MAG TPA: DUF4296 domain-containing protein [Cyclobacteriaceae bacterium]|nr:DUF4296 domain-containing protein [Cyclobacteriaceae bacterium]